MDKGNKKDCSYESIQYSFLEEHLLDPIRESAILDFVLWNEITNLREYEIILGKGTTKLL